MQILLTRDDIERIYLGHGQTKLRTDVYDLSNVLFQYFLEKYKDMKVDFDFAQHHPGMLTFLNEKGELLAGEMGAENVVSAEFKLYPVIDKPTLKKPIPSELTPTDQAKSQE